MRNLSMTGSGNEPDERWDWIEPDPRCLYNQAGIPLKGQWPGKVLLCPTTGLLAFQNFYSALPQLLRELLTEYGELGIAIGDVDNLKSYVESSKRTDPAKFGHIAGNAFMANLSAISITHFHGMAHAWSCLSSFGGDEVILASAGVNRIRFKNDVQSLSQALAGSLPRSVSFALGWFTAPSSTALSSLTDQDLQRLCTSCLATVDRALLETKRRRKAAQMEAGCYSNASHSPFIVSIRTRRLHDRNWSVSYPKAPSGNAAVPRVFSA